MFCTLSSRVLNHRNYLNHPKDNYSFQNSIAIKFSKIHDLNMLINIFLLKKVQIVLYLKPKTDYFPTEALKNQICALHRGAFCQFPVDLLQYGNTKSNRKETGKTHLCVL